MNFFKSLFGIKDKPAAPVQKIEIEVMSKTFEVDLNRQSTEEGKAEMARKKKEREARHKAFDKKQEISHIEVPAYCALSGIKDILENSYYNSNRLSKLEGHLKKLMEYMTSKHYETATQTGIRRFRKDYLGYKIPDFAIQALKNPGDFLDSLEVWFKAHLLQSIPLFYEEWEAKVQRMKQGAAKAKRKEYVLEKLNLLRAQVAGLAATPEELEKVDEVIEKLAGEDWTSI